MISLYVVQPQIPRVWPSVAHYFDRVADYHLDTEHLLDGLLDGHTQLWLGLIHGKLQGAAITQISNYPNCRTLDILVMGGDGGEWDLMIQDLEDYARAEGCTHVEIKGRAGWQRRLSGYSEIYRTFSKELDDVSTDAE